MRPRVKKLIGGLVLVVGLIVYSFIVLMIGQFRLAQSGPVVQLAFFAFFGLIWTVPAAILIRWMERVDRR